ncbi:hypothetical protein C0989_006772 [Termitomyces sp. Mn162]|nr:hypothetical protein C0989_006772 [Termitomyces sp. Mn162]
MEEDVMFAGVVQERGACGESRGAMVERAMPSSELSNALNPYANQPRPRPSYAVPYDQLAPPQPQPYVPHRSELELAISEHPPPPPYATPVSAHPYSPNAVAPRQPNPASIQAVQELLRMVASTREAQEVERKRRLEWEREQEAKYVQQREAMERKLQELTKEVITLRASNNVDPTPSSSGLLTPQHMMSPTLAIQQSPQLATPVSPVSSFPYPPFVQGSSNQHQQLYDNRFQPSPHPEPSVLQTPISAVTPSPSPHLNSVQPIQQRPQNPSAPSSRGKKRQNSELSSDSESSGSEGPSTNSHRVKPSQHAMRAHILRMMKVDTDKELPDSHTEGVNLGPNDPVRFVWDKTTKQSVHNTRMKTRILADIKSNRKKYKHVPDKDFGKKNLESCFESCFVTLRQKFKAQHNPDDAQKYKQREDNKARRARHASRKKLKLNNRAEARLKVDALQHVTFDGALQIECMSSDDSDDDGSGSRSLGILYTRGHQWRSSRLKRFYDILDEEEKQDKYLQPKRGMGKKERCVGPPKDFALPPEGVGTWMISKHWIKASQTKYPDLLTVLSKRVEDSPGFDWEGFDVLGEESDAPDDELETTANSENYALV